MSLYFLFFCKKHALDVSLSSWEFIRSHSQFATWEPAQNVLFLGKIIQKAKNGLLANPREQRVGGREVPGDKSPCWNNELFLGHVCYHTLQNKQMNLSVNIFGSFAKLLRCQPLSSFPTAQALFFLPDHFFVYSCAIYLHHLWICFSPKPVYYFSISSL